jgi:hypothetical protein
MAVIVHPLEARLPSLANAEMGNNSAWEAWKAPREARLGLGFDRTDDLRERIHEIPALRHGVFKPFGEL